MMYVVLIAGMLLLVKGADYFVDGSASVAKILKVPSLIIGLTIVALGTSLPEASVSITASIAGNNELALSNIIGSNDWSGYLYDGSDSFCHALRCGGGNWREFFDK